MQDCPIPDERVISVLAHEYDEAPVLPSGRRGSLLRTYWTAYGEWVKERAREISRDLKVKECRYEAYVDGEGIKQDVNAGFLVVTRDFAPHPLWDLETNQANRLVHDVDGHAASGEGFSWAEEIRALRRQALRTPVRFLPALFSQTLHQLSSTTHNRFFPEEQKVLLTEHGEFRALCLGTGRALDLPIPLPTHDECAECDLEHPHSHIKKETP